MKTLGPQEYFCRKGKHTWSHVEWSEKKPRIRLTCDEHQKPTSPSLSVPYSPPWKKHEKGMWNTDDKTSRESADKFHLEREHEVKTDPRAARWEKSRKASWAKDKPTWVKQQKGAT